MFAAQLIKSNIIRFRRKQRLRELISNIASIGPRAAPSDEFDSVLDSLRRNFPTSRWSKLTKRGRLLVALHHRIDSRDLPGIKEILKDISSFSEDA